MSKQALKRNVGILATEDNQAMSLQNGGSGKSEKNPNCWSGSKRRSVMDETNPVDRVFNIPPSVKKVIKKLEAGGFEGYLVGGCVRDYFLGILPLDFDLTTNATPEQMKLCFAGDRIIETGIRHGTLTVIMDGFSIEITTYRVESDYSDHRHPDSVVFTKHIEEDLNRRDFTINALAYHPEKGLLDLFGGVEDIRNQIIRCVGNPQKRMEEDALRILRGVRFASVLGFKLDTKTKRAMLQNKEKLENISAERIQVELTKLICGKDVKRVLLEETEIIGVVIPEILPSKDYDQMNPHHCYDVWTHTAVAMENTPAEPRVRWTMLFHDLGKPYTMSVGEDGFRHFKNHNLVSEDIAHTRLTALKMDKSTIRDVCVLVRYHDNSVEVDKRNLRRWLNQLTEPLLRDLLAVKKGDNRAKTPTYRERLEQAEAAETLLNELMTENPCVFLKDLAIDGYDLMELGFERGPEIGQILQRLLEGVMDEIYENNKTVLLERAKEMK